MLDEVLKIAHLRHIIEIQCHESEHVQAFRQHSVLSFELLYLPYIPYVVSLSREREYTQSCATWKSVESCTSFSSKNNPTHSFRKAPYNLPFQTMFWFFAKAARCLIATPAVESVSAPAVMNTDNADTEGGNCWICHEEGPNENGQQLMSGCCSCRGSSGYVHLPCMLEFAKTNTEREVRSGRIDRCALVKIW